MSNVIKEKPIEELYVDEGKGSKKKLGSFLVSLAKKEINNNSPYRNELIKALGGAYSTEGPKELMRFKNDGFLQHPMVCQSCSKKNSVVTKTPNKKGYECFVTANSKNITYLVKTHCATCDASKNHFISKNDLGPDAINHINKTLGEKYRISKK